MKDEMKKEHKMPFFELFSGSETCLVSRLIEDEARSITRYEEKLEEEEISEETKELIETALSDSKDHMEMFKKRLEELDSEREKEYKEDDEKDEE